MLSISSLDSQPMLKIIGSKIKILIISEDFKNSSMNEAQNIIKCDEITNSENISA